MSCLLVKLPNILNSFLSLSSESKSATKINNHKQPCNFFWNTVVRYTLTLKITLGLLVLRMSVLYKFTVLFGRDRINCESRSRSTFDKESTAPK